MKNIPNILSCFRILLIPFFIVFMVQHAFLYAGLILILSGITDMLDGFLARRFGWITQLGKILDPAADKLTQATVYISLLIVLPSYRVFFIIMLAKEFLMLLTGSYLLKHHIKITGSNYVGKTSTILFYVIMIVLLLFPNIPSNAVLISLTVVTTLSIASALSYLPFLFKYQKEIKQQSQQNKNHPTS